MQTQNTFIAHPTTSDQIDALKAFVKALKIKFEVTSNVNPYNPKFVLKILQGDEDIKKGKGRKVSLEELESLWK